MSVNDDHRYYGRHHRLHLNGYHRQTNQKNGNLRQRKNRQTNLTSANRCLMTSQTNLTGANLRLHCLRLYLCRHDGCRLRYSFCGCSNASSEQSYLTSDLVD